MPRVRKSKFFHAFLKRFLIAVCCLMPFERLEGSPQSSPKMHSAEALSVLKTYGFPADFNEHEGRAQPKGWPDARAKPAVRLRLGVHMLGVLARAAYVCVLRVCCACTHQRCAWHLHVRPFFWKY